MVTSLTGRNVIPETQLLFEPPSKEKLYNVPEYPPVNLLLAAVVTLVFDPFAEP